MPALEDHIFTQFLLDVPELFEDAVDRIKIFCNDPDRWVYISRLIYKTSPKLIMLFYIKIFFYFYRSSLGFATLSELIELRPPARPFCLKILLAYCLHKG